MVVACREEDKKYIYKSNNLIESSYKLSVSEQRLIYMGVKKLKPIFIKHNMTKEDIEKNIALQQLLEKDHPFDEIEITVSEYKKEFNIKSNNIYDTMVDISKRLFDRKIQYISESGEMVQKRWVISCSFNEMTNSIRLRFHPDLLIDMLVFKNRFTMLDYEVGKSIKNNYTYRLYELLKQYVAIGKRKFTLEQFRYKLGMNDDEYPKFANIKQKIINPSIKSLNKSSDINIEYEEIKKERKVVGVIFYIKQIDIPKKVIHEQQVFSEVALDIDNYDVFNKLKAILNIDITPQDAGSIFDSALVGIKNNELKNKPVFDYIEEKNKVMIDYSKVKRVDNPIGFLKSSLEGNWTKNSIMNKGTFNNFDQRNYSKEYLDSLENQLLGWDK